MTEKIDLKEKKIAVIGAGSMGNAIVTSLIKDGVPFENVEISEKREERRSELKGIYSHVDIYFDNKRATERADVIILAVRPKQGDEVLEEIAPALNKDKLLISIMGGRSLDSIHICLRERYLDKDYTVVRAMPNIAARVGEAMTSICVQSIYNDRLLDEKNLDIAKQIFSACGEIELVEDESMMPALTAISGCSPAFVALTASGIVLGGVEAGAEAKDSNYRVGQVLEGVGKMMKQGYTPEQIITMVCSPGGITIQGIEDLDDSGVRGKFMKAVKKTAGIS